MACFQYAVFGIGCVHPVIVNTARQLISIEGNFVCSGILKSVHKIGYMFAQDIVNIDRDTALFRNFIPDNSRGIKRIRIILSD